MPYEKEEVEGALWIKEDRNGHKFMSGTLTVRGEEFKVAIFRNDKGDNDKRPDYRLKLAKAPMPKDERIPF